MDEELRELKEVEKMNTWIEAPSFHWKCPKCGKLKRYDEVLHSCRYCGVILRYPNKERGRLIDVGLAVNVIHEEYDEWLNVDRSGEWIADDIERILSWLPTEE